MEQARQQQLKTFTFQLIATGEDAVKIKDKIEVVAYSIEQATARVNRCCKVVELQLLEEQEKTKAAIFLDAAGELKIHNSGGYEPVLNPIKIQKGSSYKKLNK